MSKFDVKKAAEILHDECAVTQDIAEAMAYMCGMINDYRTHERTTATASDEG